MHKNIRVLPVLLAGVLLMFTGCGSDRFNRYGGEENINEEEIVNEPSYVTSLDELVSGSYYVFHDGKYYEPVWDTTTFDTEKTGVSNTKTAWFHDTTVGRIPTLYEGDYLVYFADEAFNETFVFDRYEYMGYTIGISNLSKTTSGRYMFDAEKGNENIDPSSDAARIAGINEEDVIVETIGKAELRSGNVSRGGTIEGLGENKSYVVELYVGTQLKKYTIVSDSIALTSMESWKTTDYVFLKNKIIRINIPAEVNSGYYSVGGSGIFRYVKGKKYDASTDFNVANDVTKFSSSFSEDEKFIEDGGGEDISKAFTVSREADIRVYFKFEDEERANFSYDEPVVKVVGGSSVYTLKKPTKNTYDETIHLVSGRYYLTVTGLDGRAYEYKISVKGDK